MLNKNNDTVNMHSSFYYMHLTGDTAGTIVHIDEASVKHKLKTNLQEYNVKSFAVSENYIWVTTKNPNQIMKLGKDGNIIEVIQLSENLFDNFFKIKIWANDKNVFLACSNLFGLASIYQLNSKNQIHKCIDKLRILESNIHVTNDYLYLLRSGLDENIAYIIRNDEQDIEMYISADKQCAITSGIYNDMPSYITYCKNVPVVASLNFYKNSWVHNKEWPLKQLYSKSNCYTSKNTISAFQEVSASAMIVQVNRNIDYKDLYYVDLKDKSIKALYSSNNHFKLLYSDKKYMYLDISEPANDKFTLLQVDISTGMQKIIENCNVLSANNI